MSDDLRLNSIDRYRKRSDRLILEEHSSCEVPAGCGGVVLRWGRPDGGIPVSMRVSQLGDSEIYCGGEFRNNGRFMLPFGPGVLALRLSERKKSFDWLVVSTRHHSASWRPEQRVIEELSTFANQTWLFTTKTPPKDWMQPGFDDSGWETLVASQMQRESLAKQDQWQFHLSDGEIGLSLPENSDVWVRKRYTLTFES